MRLLTWLGALILIGAAVYWYVTRPQMVEAATFEGLEGDAARGETILAAAGCASCHTDPEAEPAWPPVLSGGQRFETGFGTFISPNISPGPAGIGGWSLTDFANAVKRGVSPSGAHYFPAFPYTTYIRADPQDVADLYAYMQTLPASEAKSRAHDVAFPFSIRRNLGGWKFLFLDDDWVLNGAKGEQVEHGRYLVEALGHCGECHTPRNALGGSDRSRWLGGAPHPSGKGRIPDITPGGLTWSAGEIAEYLKSGFTPDFDTAGGEMAEVVENTARLSDADRAAIAAYLKAVPAVEPAE
ncbi:c-type cytochrome [Aquicoccus sp. SCR17]|nr:c-type cytochrome [Carideicomes alvinocaridis]